jgi:ATP-dependent DNA helicase DinG
LQRLVEKCRDASDELFGDVDRWLTTQPEKSNGRVHRPDLVDNPLSPCLGELAKGITQRMEGEANEAKRQDFAAAAGRLVELSLTTEHWLRQSTPDSVYWLERTFTRTGLPRVSLVSAPLDVGRMLRERLFQQTRTVILTSATLTAGRQNFSHLQQRLGIARCETLEVESPFDFARQATLVVVPDMPDPTQQPAEYEQWLAVMVGRFVVRTQGRAFALFTSYELMRRCASRLTSILAPHNLAIYSQAESVSRSALLERFKEDPYGVLLGADSFWQGVDVPGDALQNVIITKLPFSVPDHPLTEARMEAIRQAGRNPFSEYQVPEAVIRLRQGFGRLIRTRRDRGLVVLLDPRVITKSYGRRFLDALPACRRVEVSIHDVDTLDRLGPSPLTSAPRGDDH